ncbi:MAG: TetR/AcrR family transcriptional regulator [Deltaproteobacteria bacterium]|nr:TetR/AcrR family transcriptional regulator [Deltaproteobacteria bacterium]MBW2392662.1 TetR/AcrR family transcriptional regulator [Deltaproteobacteria bacterium]
MRVSPPAAPRRTAQVTQETRELILAAAEAEFAARGFAEARLADIAKRVGITRAAVIYHFRDKSALYDAVLEAAFGPLTEQIQTSVSLPGSNAERIERVITAWFECAVERPTLGRLFIREVAAAEDTLRPEVDRLATPMFAAFLNAIEQGQRDGEFRPISAIHVANILSGAAIWLTSGAHLTGGQETEPPSERLARYGDELAGVARHLLGIRPQDGEGENDHE